jgi:hypothetical protein
MGEQTIHGWLVPRKHKPDDILSQEVSKKQMFFLYVSILVNVIQKKILLLFIQYININHSICSGSGNATKFLKTTPIWK